MRYARNIAGKKLGDFARAKVLVLGKGISGKSACDFLQARGATVTMYADQPVTNNKAENGKPCAREYDFCVVSPGISVRHDIVREFDEKAISELALGFMTPHKKVIAITGTNGKTTTVNLIYNMLNFGGMQNRAVLCGNVGMPVTAVSRQLKHSDAVVEVSSFMLELPKHFHPDIACILNLSQDHLERHETMQEYARCKANIALNQTSRDTLILNYDDENIHKFVLPLIHERDKMARPKLLFFSMQTAVCGIYIEGENIVLNLRGRTKNLCKVSDICETKRHQIENILASILVAKLKKTRTTSILTALKAPNSLKHRIWHVCTVNGVGFYDDSKATNIASTLAGCNSFTKPISLLLGGVSKGQNFDELFKNLPRNVANIFVYGQCAHDILQSAKRASFNHITITNDLESAMRTAFKFGSGERVVLLSPACASFDQFKNYQDRGNHFAKIANQIMFESQSVCGDSSSQLMIESQSVCGDSSSESESKELTDNKELLIDNKKLLIDEKKLVTGKKELVTNKNEFTDDNVTHKKELVALKKELVTDEKESMTNKSDLVTGKNELVTNKSDLVTDKNDLVTDKNELVTHKKELVTDRNELVTDRNELVIDEKELVIDRNELVPDKLEVKI